MFNQLPEINNSHDQVSSDDLRRLSSITPAVRRSRDSVPTTETKAVVTANDVTTAHQTLKQLKALYNRAKSKATQREIAWQITFDEFCTLASQTSVCPILGIVLDYSLPNGSTGGKARDNAASLDRHDSSLPYTFDNCSFVSWKGNRLKGEATVEQLEKVLAYMQSKQKTAVYSYLYDSDFDLLEIVVDGREPKACYGADALRYYSTLQHLEASDAQPFLAFIYTTKAVA